MMVWSLFSILLIPIGTFLGIVFGALPGFSAATGVALMMPFSFMMAPFEGLVLLVTIYIGAIYGGMIPALLLSIPGTPGAAALVMDGYPMAQKGKPILALSITTISAVVGTLISVLCFLLIAPVLARFSLKFGPPEMFWVIVWGLTAIVAVNPKRLLPGLYTGLLGLFLGTIGADPMYAVQRMSLGIMELYTGVPVIPSMIGMFCFAEMVLNLNLALTGVLVRAVSIKTSEFLEGLQICIRKFREMIQGSIIGTVVGILPAAGASVAAFIAYNVSRSTSKHPEEYGSGKPEGIISIATSENATVGGALIPMMTLGVPGSATTAIMLGLLMFHGLRPGPTLFLQQWPLMRALVVAMVVSALLMGVLGLIVSRYASLLTKVDYRILTPAIIILTALAALSSSNNINDVYIMFIFGILGVILTKTGFPLISLVLGIILSPIAENNLIQSLAMSNGNILIFFRSPVCLGLMVLCVLSTIYPFLGGKKERKVSR